MRFLFNFEETRVMKKLIFRSCLLMLFILSLACTKDRDDESSLLGAWIETAPIADRTELYFAPGNRLTRVDIDGNVEQYKYRIEGNTLFLSLAGDVEVSSELVFEQISQNRIKIENLYASIPEMERTFMIFERE